MEHLERLRELDGFDPGGVRYDARETVLADIVVLAKDASTAKAAAVLGLEDFHRRYAYADDNNMMWGGLPDAPSYSDKRRHDYGFTGLSGNLIAHMWWYDSDDMHIGPLTHDATVVPEATIMLAREVIRLALMRRLAYSAPKPVIAYLDPDSDHTVREFYGRLGFYETHRVSGGYLRCELPIDRFHQALRQVGEYVEPGMSGQYN